VRAGQRWRHQHRHQQDDDRRRRYQCRPRDHRAHDRRRRRRRQNCRNAMIGAPMMINRRRLRNLKAYLSRAHRQIRRSREPGCSRQSSLRGILAAASAPTIRFFMSASPIPLKTQEGIVTAAQSFRCQDALRTLASQWRSLRLAQQM
jgi:hypothetical protein